MTNRINLLQMYGLLHTKVNYKNIEGQKRKNNYLHTSMCRIYLHIKRALKIGKLCFFIHGPEFSIYCFGLKSRTSCKNIQYRF